MLAETFGILCYQTLKYFVVKLCFVTNSLKKAGDTKGGECFLTLLINLILMLQH